MRDWKPTALGDLITLQRGHDLPSHARKTGNIPIYSSAGISGYHDESKATEPGVVTGRYGTIGEVFYINEPYWPLNTSLYVIDFKGNNPKFIAYLLECINLKEMNAAGAVPGVNRNHLHKIKVRASKNRAIQNKIAAILSAYDDLIENNLQCIKLLEEMAQITYEEWFVRMKFPGHKQTPIDSETELPEGWKKGRVIDLFELQRGFDLPVQNRETGDVPILASTGIIDNHAVSKVAGPCVVTGRSGTIGGVTYIQTDFWPLNTTLWIKKFHGCGPVYAYFFLKTFDLKRMSGGAAVPSLDRKVVHSQHIIISSVVLMKKFELEISSSFILIEYMSKQNNLLKEARDILLPRLMTGMIDVDAIELPEALLARMDAEDSA